MKVVKDTNYVKKIVSDKQKLTSDYFRRLISSDLHENDGRVMTQNNYWKKMQLI